MSHDSVESSKFSIIMQQVLLSKCNDLFRDSESGGFPTRIVQDSVLRGRRRTVNFHTFTWFDLLAHYTFERRPNTQKTSRNYNCWGRCSWKGPKDYGSI